MFHQAVVENRSSHPVKTVSVNREETEMLKVPWRSPQLSEKLLLFLAGSSCSLYGVTCEATVEKQVTSSVGWMPV